MDYPTPTCLGQKAVQFHVSLLERFVVQTSCLFYLLVNCSVQESMRELADMRRDAKEKELNALLSGDQDPYPCFIEVFSSHYLKKFK